MLWVRLCLARGCRGGKSPWVFQKEKGTGWSYQATSLPCGLLSVRWILCSSSNQLLLARASSQRCRQPSPSFLHSVTYTVAVWELKDFLCY